jgi:hypothetical protein
MIKAAAKTGWLDENKAILETLTAIKRAADLIATYFAREARSCWRIEEYLEVRSCKICQRKIFYFSFHEHKKAEICFSGRRNQYQEV